MRSSLLNRDTHFGIARVGGKQKSLLVSWSMFSFEVNCTARKTRGLGELGQDPPGILLQCMAGFCCVEEGRVPKRLP